MRMSSRDWSSFPVDMMAGVVVVMAMSSVIRVGWEGGWEVKQTAGACQTSMWQEEMAVSGSDGVKRHSDGWRRFVTSERTRCQAGERVLGGAGARLDRMREMVCSKGRRGGGLRLNDGSRVAVRVLLRGVDDGVGVVDKESGSEREREANP